jgi:two-component sensor histidine kinase
MLSSELTIEHQKRGVSITTHVATLATDYVLTEDRLSLNMIIENYKEAEEEIEYIFMLDNNGMVLVHTFTDGFPVNLRTANSVMPELEFNIQTLITEKGSIFDMAVPILNGEAGVVRLGLSAEPIMEAVDRITGMAVWIIAMVLLLGIIIASALTITITAPIRNLRKASAAIGGGDLSHRVPIRTNDEIGALSETFNAMAQSLQKANKELEQSLSDKDMLIKEVHHRVKNNLAVVLSLLRLQSGQVKDERSKGYFLESQNRIRAMSMIHEYLYLSDDMTNVNCEQYIKNLINQLFQSYNVQALKTKLQVKVSDIMLDLDTMILCGLIINELVSNALKYAFPDESEGELTVELSREKDDKYVLAVKDNGVGLPQDLDIYNTESLGMQIVASLATQLKGMLELNREDGTDFRIIFREKRFVQ